MHSLERALALLERELGVAFPRALFLPGGAGEGEPIDPEALLDPHQRYVRGGDLLADALPFARLEGGAELALRFDGRGRPLEVVRASPGGAWHPSGEARTLPSEPARHRQRAAEALDSGLARLARATGTAALARDLGVARETLADWLLDARLVPEPSRAALRRLTGGSEDDLFDQDWEGAAVAAGRAAAARPDLAWPGAVRGWFAEGRERPAEAAAAYGDALRAFATTLDFAGALFQRPGERGAEALVAAWERCAPSGEADDEDLASALAGAEVVRSRWLAACDRARAAGHAEAAWGHALRAGWHRHRLTDMDDVLGRMLDAAEAAGSRAHAALARLHLRAWAGRAS